MKCPDCGAELNETETFYDCVACGYFEVKEPYASINKKNTEFLKRLRNGDPLEDDDENSDGEDDDEDEYN